MKTALKNKRVYVAHPFGNDPKNEEKVKEIIKKLQKISPETIFYNGITAFGFLYEEVDYQHGMDMCLDLLDYCEVLFVFGDYKNSKGCLMEIEHFEKQGKPIIFAYKTDVDEETIKQMIYLTNLIKR